jgi:integrase
VTPSIRKRLTAALRQHHAGGWWAAHPPLECVQLLRTADGDGVDGGAMITADLRFGERTVRVGTGHQGFDDFVDDEATSGIDAAVEALGHVADLVNREVAGLLEATADRALVAFYVSTGARASELLGASFGDADAGQQLITVIRKGTRALQPLPASPDAFVWLRLYQAQIQGLVPVGRDQPLWWTLRRPFRPLSYHAAHRMFERVNASLGANWTLHDLRHTAAYRMARDPALPLTDVQWCLAMPS